MSKRKPRTVRKPKALFSEGLVDKIKTRKLVEMRVDELINNPMNPPERTELNVTHSLLRKGIKEVGVLDVIHVCGDTMTTINGHQRVKSAHYNGTKTIMAYRYDGLTEDERNILFAHLNSTSTPYTGSQKLFTYLNGGKVDSAFESHVIRILDVGDNYRRGHGMKFLNTIRKQRKSPASYTIGIKEYCRVIGDESPKTEAKVLNWMINIGSPHRLKSLISLKCPARLLIKAVETSKPILGTWEITAV